MYKLGKYKGTDRMCDLVEDNHSILLIMSRFGIALGFGESSVEEVCRQNGVDVSTFLAIANLSTDEAPSAEEIASVSPRAFLHYLHNSHDYFLQFRLPAIRRKLTEATEGGDEANRFVLLRFFDEYAAEVERHMAYEEQTVFPYVRALIEGRLEEGYDISVFHRRHDAIELKIIELKNILLKHYPARDSNEMNSALFDIFLCEEDLTAHNHAENVLFVPLVEALERQLKTKGRKS